MSNTKGKGNMMFIAWITVVATLGGLLFGYDTGVVNGALGFAAENLELTPTEIGFEAAIALIGCAIGALIAGDLTMRFGRKKMMLLAAVLFGICAIGLGMATDKTSFGVYRLIGGLGVGIASMISPMYIGEIAPAHMRGKLVSFNQFAIIFGMLVVYFVNFYVAKTHSAEWNVEEGWRWMFGSQIIPAGLFFFLLLFIPESPRWLAMKGRDAEAEAILAKVNGEEAVPELMASIKKSLEGNDKISWIAAFKIPGAAKIIFIGILISVFQQITGINAFLYYSTALFEDLGTPAELALKFTILLGIVNLAFTVLAIFSVDKFGRKPLLMIGVTGMAISMFALGTMTYLQIQSYWALGFVLMYIASFAMSLGPVTWVLIAEMFPNAYRGVGMSIAIFFQWMANFAVSQTFPMMMDKDSYLMEQYHGGFPFWIFGIMSVLGFFFYWKMVPETKGASLEDMENVFRPH